MKSKPSLSCPVWGAWVPALIMSALIIAGCVPIGPTAPPETVQAVETPAATPTPLPTAVPIRIEGGGQDEAALPTPAWKTYANDDYLFTFSYPPTWLLEDIPAGQEFLGGKSARAIRLTQGALRLLIQYKSNAEVTVLGTGSRPPGQVVDRGAVTFLEREIPRHVLVLEGKDKLVFYGDRFKDLEFYLQLDYHLSAGEDYEAIEIPEAIQAEVDEILETFARTGELVHPRLESLTYDNAAYGFSLQYPSDWTLDETPHAVSLTRGTQALVIEFRRATEDVRIGPTGTPTGEFVEHGTISTLGDNVPRMVLKFEGNDKGVYYNGTSPVQAGRLEFMIVLSENSTNDQAALPEAVQAEVDQIIRSLAVTGPQAPAPVTDCTTQLSFVSDVTIPDDTVLPPEEAFVKTWRLLNSGTCTWDAGYALVCTSGDCMNSSTAVPLPEAISPGDTVEVSADLVAPAAEGTYTGNWQLRDANGDLHGVGGSPGQPFWVKIVVGTPPSDLINYVNMEYSFAFQYPPSWSLQEASHAITLSQGSLELLVEYRGDWESVSIGPSGLPAGDIVERGTVEILGQDLPRKVIVYQGNDKGVYYGGAPAEIRAGNLGFVIALSEHDADPAFSIPADVQAEVDAIVQSLTLTAAPPW